MDRSPIDWAKLAGVAGIVTRKMPSGASATNQGSEEGRRALEWLIGEDNIRGGVELWLAGRHGEQAAASAAWSVLTYIRSRKATEIAYGAYRRAREWEDADMAVLAVGLIGDICHPDALDWVDEFVTYPPTANPGLGLVDQALFRGVIYSDDARLEPWLRTAETSTDTWILEAARRIRTDMARPARDLPTQAGPEAPGAASGT